MNRIKRHLPLFIEHDEEDLVTVEFATVDELLAIEWVARWRQNPEFIRFIVKSPPHLHLHALCVEVRHQATTHDYVLGFLDAPVVLSTRVAPFIVI